MSALDPEALRAFYVESRQRLFTYALSITRHRESAEDAIHAVFLELLRQRPPLEEIQPYVFRCVRNAALDAMRRARVRDASIFAERPVPDAPVTAASSALHPHEVETFLRQLSDDERETIVLKIYGDLTFQEIAVLRAVPLPTVSSWYRRGLEKMKTLLAAEPR